MTLTSDQCDQDTHDNGFWRQLRVNEAQRAVLRTQGFIARERRGGDRIVYKLRFRYRGKQHVRCLGSDLNFVAEVKRELDRLQSLHHKLRRLDAITRTAQEELTNTKQSLSSFLGRRGMHFHGLAIRRSKAVDPR